VKVLHWNIHGWRDPDGVSNIDRVARLIDAQRPDVVSLVEVDEPWGEPVGLRRVAESTGYRWAFIPTFEYRQQGGFGNAILTRAAIRSVQQWQLLPPMLYDGSEPTEPRSVLLVDVDVADRRVTVGCTHLPRHDLAMRQVAAGRLLDLLRAAQAPLLLCGDFNWSAAAWLPADVTAAPQPAVCTYPATDPVEAIDYAVSTGVKITQAAVLSDRSSDHLPLLVEADPR
jgi:endonuclease/exonuclease/phosphatase family metal-dependent hydrolase